MSVPDDIAPLCTIYLCFTMVLMELHQKMKEKNLGGPYAEDSSYKFSDLGFNSATSTSPDTRYIEGPFCDTTLRKALRSLKPTVGLHPKDFHTEPCKSLPVHSPNQDDLPTLDKETFLGWKIPASQLYADILKTPDDDLVERMEIKPKKKKRGFFSKLCCWKKPKSSKNVGEFSSVNINKDKKKGWKLFCCF